MRIGFDFDGVLCLTPFGRLAVHAPGDVPELPQNYEAMYGRTQSPNPLRLAVEYLRFGWRRMSPEAAGVLRDLSARHEVYIITGRSVSGESLIRRWLRARALDGCVSGIEMAPSGLRPAQHKLARARMLGIEAQIDDDPRTAYYLAEHGVPRVFLLGHAGAHRDAPLPPRLALVRTLGDFAAALRD